MGETYHESITLRFRRDILIDAFTSSELIKHVRSEKIAAYWFGPVPGYRYTIIDKNRHEIIVTYLPQGVSLHHSDMFNLTIETESKILGSDYPAMSDIVSDKDDFVTSRGVVGTVYSSAPQRVRFSIPSTDKIVEVQYPLTKRIYDVYVDGERLKLISETKP